MRGPLPLVTLVILFVPTAHAATPSTPRAQAVRSAATADSTFLQQYAATYRFRLGQPNAIRVTPGGDAVLFLRSGPRSFVQDLWEFDTARRQERVLLTADKILRGHEEQLSAEERARRERQRQAARGIASYQLSEDGKRILVPLAGRLFVIERSSGAVTELKSAAGDPIDPQLSPDGAYVACVRNGDLYVTDVATGRERRLTDGASETITHGLAEFVAQEEMDRFSGYWWSPNSRAIAYESADLSPIEVLHIMDPTHPEREPEGWRFPRVGTRNAIVRLGVIAITGGPTTWIPWDRDHYPYLASVHWTKNAPLTVGVIDRRQSEYLVFAADPATGKTHPLVIEHDDAWINLEQSVPRWLEDGSGFLWMTERGGAWQLELRGSDGKLQRSLTRPDLGLRNLIGVDDAARVAWIEAGDDPTQVQLYRVPFGAGASGPQRVTRDAGVHSGTFGKRSRVWVHGFEGPKAGPVKRVENVDGTVVGELVSAAERPSLETHVRFVAVGQRRIRGVVIEPEGFDPHASYPVIVSVYGGPHSQMVVQSHNRYLLDQWIANHGFVVVSFDGRGTPSRGRTWERAIRHNLIDVPLNDQVEALQALGREMPQLDLTRVGIYGWSFGGYFSAMAAMRRPDVFRAGVAGAPVADFRDYDTFYTERYLDLPERNAAGYRASSVLTYADKLERPLLIVHGTSDDNVYFLHSLKLCDALFRAGKPYEFMPLAGFTHMVPDPLVTSRLYGRVEAFFEKNVAHASTPMGERAER